ncbi:MAG: glycosyltransferase family 2 protein [Candidatus Dormibacteria bacterium]
MSEVATSDQSLDLDVLVRTMPGRLALLTEALASLVALRLPAVRALVIVDTRDPDYLPAVVDLTERLESSLHCDVITAPEAESRGKRLNRGLDRASAEFVGVLDDDDVYLPAFGSHLLPYLREHRECAVAYGIGQVVEGASTRDGFRASQLRESFAFPFDVVRLAAENFIPPCTIAVRRSVLVEQSIRFDPQLWGLEDWAFLLDIAVENDFAFIPVPVAEWRRWHRAGISASSERVRKRQARAQIESSRYDRALKIPLNQLARLYRDREVAQAHADSADHLLDLMLHSRSWKLTRPLRRATKSALPDALTLIDHPVGRDRAPDSAP